MSVSLHISYFMFGNQPCSNNFHINCLCFLFLVAHSCLRARAQRQRVWRLLMFLVWPLKFFVLSRIWVNLWVEMRLLEEECSLQQKHCWQNMERALQANGLSYRFVRSNSSRYFLFLQEERHAIMKSIMHAYLSFMFTRKKSYLT